MGMPWSIDFTPARAHCWLSENFSVPTETLCLDRPESPNGDFVCCAAKGHRGKHDHRWTGDRFPDFRAVSHRQAASSTANAVGISALRGNEPSPQPIQEGVKP